MVATGDEAIAPAACLVQDMALERGRKTAPREDAREW
jgi:hypothetical protein